MELKKYEKPLFVEELVFQVDPELLESYLDGDFECFTLGLEKYPGFSGSQIWVSQDRPGYVRNIIFWEDEASMKAVDPAWIAAADARLNAMLGEGKLTLLEAAHTVNRMGLAREYR